MKQEMMGGSGISWTMCKTRAEQLLRWAIVWPQETWAENGEGLHAVGALGPH